jgi:2'-5' RNA ligase
MAKGKSKFQKQRPPDELAVGTDWRLFIAIPLPDEARQLLARITESLAAHDWPVRWVATDAAHLTLHFLGNTAPERAELLRLGLSRAIASHGAFTISTGALGAFPDLRDPRVLWLGLTGDTTALANLHRDLGRSLQALGFEIDGGRFHPHLTLGRLREETPSRLKAEIRATFDDPDLLAVVGERALIDVRQAILYRSFLERGGARHEPLASYSLQSKA